MEEYKKIELLGDIKLIDPTPDMFKAAAAVIDLPAEKQNDLQYMTAVYLSTTTNLNGAHFLGSEVHAARNTIASKALDIEHIEDQIIGHIYSYAFMDEAGNKIDPTTLDSMDIKKLDEQNYHVVIAAVVYKNRFPDIASEIAAGDWKVSMETYYKNYDIKIGSLIISLDEAKTLGLKVEDSSIIGKTAKVIRNKKVVANGKIARVLRNLMFSGCGIVKNPANPVSLVIETANVNKEVSSDDSEIILSYDLPTLKDKAFNTEAPVSQNDNVSQCISFKKEVLNTLEKDQDSKVLHTNWCAAFDKACTSWTRDTTDPKCLRNIALINVTTACIKEHVDRKEANDKRKGLLKKLQASLKKATKLT